MVFIKIQMLFFHPPPEDLLLTFQFLLGALKCQGNTLAKKYGAVSLTLKKVGYENCIFQFLQAI